MKIIISLESGGQICFGWKPVLTGCAVIQMMISNSAIAINVFI